MRRMLLYVTLHSTSTSTGQIPKICVQAASGAGLVGNQTVLVFTVPRSRQPLPIHGGQCVTWAEKGL